MWRVENSRDPCYKYKCKRLYDSHGWRRIFIAATIPATRYARHIICTQTHNFVVMNYFMDSIKNVSQMEVDQDWQ